MPESTNKFENLKALVKESYSKGKNKAATCPCPDKTKCQCDKRSMGKPTKK